MNKKNRKKLNKILTHGGIVLFASFIVLPVLLSIIYSFVSPLEINDITDAINSSNGYIKFSPVPTHLSLQQYFEILIGNNTYLVMFWNSMNYTIVIVISQIIIAIFAAYAFAFMEFRAKKIIFFIYIVVMVMPFQVTLVPSFIVLNKLNLIYTKWAIYLPGIFSPFAVVLLTQFMKTINREVLEAAQIDGANYFNIITRIVIPISIPGIAAVVLLIAIDNWGMIEQPLIFLENADMYPLSIGLQGYIESAMSVAFAGSVLYALPAVILFLYLRKYLILGLSLTDITK